MKKISIKKTTEPDKSNIYTRHHHHTTKLGNGVTIICPNYKDYKKVIASVNFELTEVLFELNDLYSTTFQEYRKIWFYLDETMTTKLTRIPEYISDIEKNFKLASQRSHWANGNYFVFNYFNFIINTLTEWLGAMADIRLKKRQFIEKRFIERKQNDLILLQNHLKLIGSITPVNEIKHTS